MSTHTPPLTQADPRYLQALQQVDLLQDLPPQAMADIAACSRPQHCRARQELIARDDVDRDCFFVLTGRLRVTLWSPAGREISFREAHAGETVGEIAAIDGRPRSATVVAITDADVARLSPEKLEDLMRRHWPICQRMLEHLAGAARQLTDRLYALSTHSVAQRLAAELLRLAAPAAAGHAARLDHPPSQPELARRIGSVRLQVLREMQSLEALGVVRRQGDAIELPDLRRLARFVDGGAA